MLLHPSPVLIDVSGIDDNEEVVLLHFVNEQVVNSATVFVAHHAIEDFSVFHAAYIIGKDMVNVCLGILSLYSHLSHMRYIKHAAVSAHSLMFLYDS